MTDDEMILSTAQGRIEEKRRKNRCACGTWKQWSECTACEGNGDEPRDHDLQGSTWTTIDPCAQCAGFGGALVCKSCDEQQRRTR